MGPFFLCQTAEKVQVHLQEGTYHISDVIIDTYLDINFIPEEVTRPLLDKCLSSIIPTFSRQLLGLSTMKIKAYDMLYQE